MLLELSSLLLAKNYISIWNLLNDMRTIEDQHRNMSHYHFCLNKNKQTVISIITDKFFASIETTCTDHIFSALITSTSFVLFIYLNQKFDSVTSKLENWTDAWYDSQTNSKKLIIEEKSQLQKQDHCWSCRESDHWDSDKICFFHNHKQLNIMTASTHKFSNSEESKVRKA